MQKSATSKDSLVINTVGGFLISGVFQSLQKVDF